MGKLLNKQTPAQSDDSEGVLMNKIEALNYLVDNRIDFDEWTGAGMADCFVEIIKSENATFDKSYLHKLLEDAANF